MISVGFFLLLGLLALAPRVLLSLHPFGQGLAKQGQFLTCIFPRRIKDGSQECSAQGAHGRQG